MKELSITRYDAKTRYRGQVASEYVARRASSPKWDREQAIVDAMVAAMGPGSSILDVPVGTGRFLDVYGAHHCSAVGIDISRDMLSLARSSGGHALVGLAIGDAESLPLRPRSVDFVVCTRLLNWLPRAVMERTLVEFGAATRRGILVELRVQRPMLPAEFVAVMLARAMRSPQRLVGLSRKVVAGVLRLFGRSRRRATPTPETNSTGFTLHSEKDLLHFATVQGMHVAQTEVVDIRWRLTRLRAEQLSVYLLLRPES